MSIGIYSITNYTTGCRYIGSSVAIKKRFAAHRCCLRKGTHHSIKLQRAWNKYGEHSFLFQILDYCDDPVELISWEQQWIDSLKPVYNVKPLAGRGGGWNLSDQDKFRLAKANSARLKNKPGFFTGQKHSKESKIKMAKAKLGTSRVFTTEHKFNLSQKAKARTPTANFTGKHHTNEARAKIGLAKKGQPWSPARREAYMARKKV